MLKLVILLLIGCSLCMPLSQPARMDIEMSRVSPASLLSQEPVVKTWHHDCSNTSGFRIEELPRHFDLDVFSYEAWVNTEGILESDAQNLYMTNITEPQSDYSHFYYGPTAIYDLPDTFPASGLRNFSVQIELANSNPEDSGIAAVALLDETLRPVLLASCEDKYSIAEGFLSWKYYPRNFSVLDDYFGKYPYDYRIFADGGSLDFGNATWSASYIHGQGIRGNIPAYDILNDSIVADIDMEPGRAIRYLGLAIGGYYGGGFQPVLPFLS
jgi:hypothetical protein